MKKINIYGSLFITLLTRIESIWALVLLLINLKTKKMDSNVIHIDTWYYWAFQILIALGIFVFSFFVLLNVEKLKNRLNVFDIISRIRNRYFFISSFNGIEFYKTPFETEEEFFKRIPEGQYRDYLKNEIKILKEVLIKKFDKKPTEVDSIINEVYGLKKKGKNEPNRNLKQNP